MSSADAPTLPRYLLCAKDRVPRSEELRWSWKAKRKFLLYSAAGLFPRRCNRDARTDAARRISRSGTQNHSNSASSQVDRTVTARAPTFAASARALCSERGESRATISAIAKPALFRATARKVAKFPAPTIVTVGLVFVPDSVKWRSPLICLFPLQLFGSTAQHTLYCCHDEIVRSKNKSPRPVIPRQLSRSRIQRHHR